MFWMDYSAKVCGGNLENPVKWESTPNYKGSGSQQGKA
jgi:hypothetical protein